MMPLLERCRILGVRLWVEDGQLHFEAPRGEVVGRLRADLTAHKPELIAALTAPATPVSPTWEELSEHRRGPTLTPPSWRDILPRWSIQWRERWGTLANQLAESGTPWPDDERRAFIRVVAERKAKAEAVGKQPAAGEAEMAARLEETVSADAVVAPAGPATPSPVDDAVVHKAEIIDVMCSDGKVFFVSPHLDPERPSKANLIIDVSDKPKWVNPQ